MSNMMLNPLINNIKLNMNNIKKEFNIIYILTLSDNIQKIDESIYSYTIDKELYDNISKNLLLIKVPMSLINNENHYTRLTILSDSIIERFNFNNYKLEDKNLVLQIFNISYENIKLYLLQYEDTNTFVNIYKQLIINRYFNVTNLQMITNNILSMSENNNWFEKSSLLHNKYISYFEDRKINYHFLKKNAQFENYLNNSIVKYNNLSFDNYKINTNNDFTKEEITNLLTELPTKPRFLLFCNLLISESYSHLILNNKELLIFMKPVITQFIQLFRYLFSYAWMIFYFDEISKKSYIKKEDNCIFTIDTASHLPLFPFSIHNPKMNPYSPILLDDHNLNSEYNIGGIVDYKASVFNKNNNNNYKMFSNNGIANMNEFKDNLNIFLTGDSTKNILENINWKKLKIAIGGSIMCACIQKHHPLIDLFSNFPEKDRLKRYFNEYYANADVDIMFINNNELDFMDNVNEFYDQIVFNICKINQNADISKIKLECNKHIYLFVTENDINNIISKNSEISYNKIVNNFDELDIKNLFLDLLNEQLEKYKKNFFSKLTDEQIEIYKVKYYDYTNFDNINFRIRLAQNSYETNIGVTFKYKLHSEYLDHPFELFMIKYDFMSVVQKFHLPCVRTFYDGDNVYLTPSCISAHLTYMNIDYKYFAGSSNPIEIINKYRMRGFGTWLNEHEKFILIKYSVENQNWNNLYTININNDDSIISNLGSLNINHKLFRPRLYNPDNYINCKPVDIQSGYFNINTLLSDTIKLESFKTKIDYINELDQRYNIYNDTDLHNILQNLQAINEKGGINPIQKWIIESSWNISEHDNEYILKTQNTPLKYKYKMLLKK